MSQINHREGNAAERLIATARNNEQIVIEVKSFIGRSLMKDFQDALGQYLVYENILSKALSENESGSSSLSQN